MRAYYHTTKDEVPLKTEHGDKFFRLYESGKIDQLIQDDNQLIQEILKNYTPGYSLTPLETSPI
jgi:hypothetical protein